MPLGNVPIGKEVTISDLTLDKKMQKHFSDMGLIIGQNITLLSSRQGALILKVKNGRVAINKGLSMKIFVS